MSKLRTPLDRRALQLLVSTLIYLGCFALWGGLWVVLVGRGCP
jgi:hypothetical protein